MPASQFPPLQSKPSGKHCTNCSAKMTLYSLPGHYNSTVDIDVCMNCNALWFDQYESMQLSPDGTVALFQLINERGGTATSAASKFSDGLRCVTCGEAMRLTQDRVRNTRFAYQACRHGHGRMTTFYNFLAEKQFVRELTKIERDRLAATVHQVRCSGCGAAVNLGKVDACEYCRAPVAVFDRDAAKKAIDHYLQERQKQRTVVITERRETARSAGSPWSSYDRADLGADILYALGRAATRLVSGGGRTAPAIGGAASAPVFAERIPDATSALFGSDVASSAGASLAGSVTNAAAGWTTGTTEALGNALPSATDALFGNAASVFSEAAASSVSDTAASVVSDVVASALASVSEGALGVASDAASSAGDGVIDLVTDGIGSLLGSIFD